MTLYYKKKPAYYYYGNLNSQFIIFLVFYISLLTFLHYPSVYIFFLFMMRKERLHFLNLEIASLVLNICDPVIICVSLPL